LIRQCFLDLAAVQEFYAAEPFMVSKNRRIEGLTLFRLSSEETQSVVVKLIKSLIRYYQTTSA